MVLAGSSDRRSAPLSAAKAKARVTRGTDLVKVKASKPSRAWVRILPSSRN